MWKEGKRVGGGGGRTAKCKRRRSLASVSPTLPRAASQPPALHSSSLCNVGLQRESTAPCARASAAAAAPVRARTAATDAVHPGAQAGGAGTGSDRQRADGSAATPPADVCAQQRQSASSAAECATALDGRWWVRCHAHLRSVCRCAACIPRCCCCCSRRDCGRGRSCAACAQRQAGRSGRQISQAQTESATLPHTPFARVQARRVCCSRALCW